MPASGDVLLDTSVVIPYFKRDAAIRQQVQACATLYLPQTALGELYCGAYLSANQSRTLAEITNFLNAVVVLSPGLGTADHYGQIRAALARAGTPIASGGPRPPLSPHRRFAGSQVVISGTPGAWAKCFAFIPTA